MSAAVRVAVEVEPPTVAPSNVREVAAVSGYEALPDPSAVVL